MSKKYIAMAMVAVSMLFLATSATAVNYNSNTTIIVYIHGFDTEGYAQTGVYGDDATDSGILDAVIQCAALIGAPTWQTDPYAPNQVCGADYYGDTAPAWYTAADIAEDAAQPYRVPKYALRMAKYIQHVIARSGATGATVLGGSFGGEISRYMIEHDLCGLASNQLIPRWIPVVGVVQGNWAASNAPGWLADLLGVTTPDIDDMTYSWVNNNISSGAFMNTALFAPMVISQFVSTADGDGYITALNNRPNDGVNMVSDCSFSGYTTTAALHAATDGTLQMPTKAYYPTEHKQIADHQGFWAGAVAAATNNKRVSISLSRLKTLVTGETFGNGEWVFSCNVVSPMAATLYGVTAPIEDLVWSDGVSVMLAGMGRGTTKYPNWTMFDMIVPPGESSLTVTFSAYELDFFNRFYDMWEIGSTRTMGSFTVSINVNANNMITVSNGNMQADLTTSIKYVY